MKYKFIDLNKLTRFISRYHRHISFLTIFESSFYMTLLLLIAFKMYFGMVRSVSNDKILYAIIVLDTIKMMNYLISIKHSVKFGFHNKAMLTNISILSRKRMLGRVDINVAPHSDFTASPFWVIFPGSLITTARTKLCDSIFNNGRVYIKGLRTSLANSFNFHNLIIDLGYPYV